MCECADLDQAQVMSAQQPSSRQADLSKGKRPRIADDAREARSQGTTYHAGKRAPGLAT